MSRVRGGVLAALAAAAIAIVGEDEPSPVLMSQECSQPLQVDGRLYCAATAPQFLERLCPTDRRPTSTDPALAGDSLVTAQYCRPGHASRLSPDRGWSRMSPQDLAHLRVAIDLNAASAAELTSLRGVGPVVASRIVEARPFEQVDELLEVRGIGPVTLRRNRARLRVTQP